MITSIKTDTTEYLGLFQYKNRALLFIHHPEGYIDFKEQQNRNIYNYVYNYKDHLGNTRLSYSDMNGDGIISTYKEKICRDRGCNYVEYITKSEILEESHFYPFGLQHTYNAYPQGNKDNGYKYKYQGQERQDELGLNWDSFKWRNYDYALGRFMSVDPLAEDYRYQSPYNFAENWVLSHIEIEGLEGMYSNNPGLQKWGTNLIQYGSLPFRALDRGYTSISNTVKKTISTFKMGNATKETSLGIIETTTLKSNFTDFFTNHNNAPLISMSDIFTLSKSIKSFTSTSVKVIVPVKRVPVNIEGKATTSSDGSEKIEASASLGNGETGKVGFGVGLIIDSEGNKQVDSNFNVSTPEFKNDDNSTSKVNLKIGVKNNVER